MHQIQLRQFDKKSMDEIYQSMFAFAYNQLNHEQHAKDVVQDALLNALKYADSFQGKSAFKTWVFAILKNKIADFIRQNKHYEVMSDISENSDEEFLAMLFDDIGHWQNGSSPNAFDNRWASPHETAENDEFCQVLELCLENLPKEQAQVFLMKEYIELGSDEICKNLNITRQNLYVLLHRARLRLQMCLSVKWFV